MKSGKYALTLFVAVFFAKIAEAADSGEFPQHYEDWMLNVDIENENFDMPIPTLPPSQFNRTVNVTRTRKMGENLRLFFKTFFGTSSFCLWIRNGSLLKPDKYHNYQLQPSDGNCNLQITNVNLEDNAVFRGVAYSFLSNQSVSSLFQYTVIVYVAPQSPIIIYNNEVFQSGQEIHIPRNDQPIDIKCALNFTNYKGYIYWVLDSNVMRGSTSWVYDNTTGLYTGINSILIPLNVTVSQDLMDKSLGCIVVHPAYNSPKYTTVILRTPGYTTAVHAYFQYHYESRQLTVLVGSRVLMYCEANGEPHPKYYWTMKKESESTWSKQVEIQNSTVPVQFGNTSYRCQAQNNMSEELPSSQLIIIGISIGTHVEALGFITITLILLTQTL